MNYINATGRRKAAVARVYVSHGSGSIIVNNRDYKEYFSVEMHQLALSEPLRIIEAEDKYDIKVNVNGGGVKGQAEAIQLGIARALVKEAELLGKKIEVEKGGGMLELNEVKYSLKSARKNIMTRDSRVVERKKYGQRKARKKEQYSKR